MLKTTNELEYRRKNRINQARIALQEEKRTSFFFFLTVNLLLTQLIVSKEKMCKKMITLFCFFLFSVASVGKDLKRIFFSLFTLLNIYF